MNGADARPPAPLRYVLIASNAYSGSTLLSYMLGQHPQIATVSDVSGTRRLGQMETFFCSCGLRMRDCPFWQRIEERMRLSGYAGFTLEAFGLGFDSGWPAWLAHLRARSLRWRAIEDARDLAFSITGSRRLMERLAARNLAFAQAVAAETGACVFVDASKERMRARFLERYLRAELLVIHLVRDVRGVVDSTVRRAKLQLTSAEAARRWARTNDTIERNLRTIPAERRIMVRYEDLCRAPAASLAALFEFCGVSREPVAGELRTAQHLIGNRIRLARLDEVRLDEEWRQRLSDTVQRGIIDAAGATYRRLYGDGAVAPTLVGHA